jgi:5-methylcytosine-specific restriction endonuclease McrA
MAKSPQYRRMKGAQERKPTRELSSSERGYDNYWTKVIAPAVRERDGWMCVKCSAGDLFGPVIEEMETRRRNKDGALMALIVDHIIPAHRIPRSKFHDMDNLQTLCAHHHSLKTVDDLKKYGAAKR